MQAEPPYSHTTTPFPPCCRDCLQTSMGPPSCWDSCSGKWWWWGRLLASSLAVLCHVLPAPTGLGREERYCFNLVLIFSGCGRYPNANYFPGWVPLGFPQPLLTVQFPYTGNASVCSLWKTLPLLLIWKFTLQTPSWVLATQGQPPSRDPVTMRSSLILLCQTLNTSHSQHVVLVKGTLKWDLTSGRSIPPNHFYFNNFLVYLFFAINFKSFVQLPIYCPISIPPFLQSQNTLNLYSNLAEVTFLWYYIFPCKNFNSIF